jgi:hypothetical protein
LDKDIITVTDYEMTLHLLDQNSESLKRNYEYDEDQELLMWINNYLVANEIPDERSTGKKMSDEVSLESITSYIKWESDDTVKLSVRKLHFLLAEYDIAVKFFRKDVLSKGGNPDALIKSSRRQLTYVIIDVEKLRSILNKE